MEIKFLTLSAPLPSSYKPAAIDLLHRDALSNFFERLEFQTPGTRLRMRPGGVFGYSSAMSFLIAEPNSCKMSLLPFLGDVERPLELQVLLLVVVNEGRDGVVVAAGEHAGGGLFLVDYTARSVSFSGRWRKRCRLTLLGVQRLLIRVGSV